MGGGGGGGFWGAMGDDRAQNIFPELNSMSF